jgi:DNA-binding transcriptional MerR regulator
MKTSDVARALGVGPDSVRKLHKLGLLPAVQLSPGGYRLYRPEDVRALRDRGTPIRKRRRVKAAA